MWKGLNSLKKKETIKMKTDEIFIEDEKRH